VDIRVSQPAGALERTSALVEALRAPECYFHPANDIEVLQTHISFVVLAGPFAYKIKKPVKLPFLDFSTLQTRRHYCEEEVRLNARTAPELYLGVVPIAGNFERPVMGGMGEAIEYAVRMRRFPAAARLDHLAASDRLEARHVDALANEIARLHAQARRADPRLDFGSPDGILHAALDNFASIQLADEPGDTFTVPRSLYHWTTAEHARLRDLMRQRRLDGFVRECHGDLHLANVVLLETGPVLFDCVEFNSALRWIDVASDAAFAFMDLHFHGYPALAARLAGAYFERTDDYAGLELLRFYAVYRAMVRAKIAAISVRQPGIPRHDRDQHRAAFARYVELAQRLALCGPVGIVAMHGFSGSGKSVVSETLAERLGAIRIRSDVVRKYLHGLPPSGESGSHIQEGLYAPASSTRTYLALAARAMQVVHAGYPVIVDATFLDRAQRRRFSDLADSLGVPFAIVDCTASPGTLRERILRRSGARIDPSEANLAVLDHQMRSASPLGPGEREGCITCDTESKDPGAQAAERLLTVLAQKSKEEPCVTSTSSTATPTASAPCTS
jgi:aminoglycoside phosphotransferase family enzyme/predicted kinase